MDKFYLESFFNDSDFVKKETPQKEPVLAMVFEEMQPITEIYNVDEALKNGTLFKNLNKPLWGGDTKC